MVELEDEPEAAGTKAREARFLASRHPPEERRECPVEAGERPPGHGHPVLQEVGPGFVQVLQLGELVEPGDAHAPLPGFPSFLERSVVGLTLHVEQVLQRPGLASRWLEHVLVGPERTHMQRTVRVGTDRKWPVLAQAEEISWRAGRLPPCCLASGESLVRQPHAAFSIAQFVLRCMP